MRNLPLVIVKNFEVQGYYFTDRFWPNKGEAVLDSLFYGLYQNKKTRSISLQSLQAKLSSFECDNFNLLKNLIKKFEEVLKNPSYESLQNLSSQTKDDNYIEHIQRFNSKFENLEKISEELNTRITVFTNLEDHEKISCERFFCPLELFIFQHSHNSFEVVGRDNGSEFIYKLDNPSSIGPLSDSIHTIICNRGILETLETEILIEILNKIRYINKRYKIVFNTDHLEFILTARMSSNLGVNDQEISKPLKNYQDLENLLKIPVNFNTQQSLPSNIKVI